MKLSNKLLIGTLILLFGGLIYFNSVLNSVYEEINFADEFYEFNQEKDLKFEHIKVLQIEGIVFSYLKIS